MSNSLLRFLTRSRGDVARTRQPSGVDGGMVYLGLGKPRVVQGDEDFPFFKDPPQNDVPVEYLSQQTLVQADDFGNTALYVDGPALDVRGLRGVQLYLIVSHQVQGDPAVIGGLSVLPEAALRRAVDDEPEWFPLTTIDTSLTTDGTPDESYSRRSMYATELVFDPLGGISPAPTPADGDWRYAVPFDVTPWDFVRFRFGGRGAPVIAAAFVAGNR